MESSNCLTLFLVHLRVLVYIFVSILMKGCNMNIWRTRFSVLLLLLLCSPTELYAENKKQDASLFHSIVQGFIPVRATNEAFLQIIARQMPKNAELIDVFIPKTFKITMERGNFDQITHMVYLYALPAKLQPNIATRKQQFARMRLALENAYEGYVGMAAPTDATQKRWEKQLYPHVRRSNSIYFLFPKNVAFSKYSVMFNFSLGKEQVLPVFLSTYMFIHDARVYFLSATATVADSNYWEELNWTRDTIHEFARSLLVFPENELVSIP